MASIFDNTLLDGDRIFEEVLYVPLSGLAGGVVATSSLAGNITVMRRFEGSVLAATTMSGDLLFTGGFSGGAIGDSNVTGNLTLVGALPLVGSIQGSSSMVGAFVGGVSTLNLRGPLRMVQVVKLV